MKGDQMGIKKNPLTDNQLIKKNKNRKGQTFKKYLQDKL